MREVAGLAVRLHEQAVRCPGSPFLRWRGTTTSYAEADVLVRQCAAVLRARDAAGGGTGRVVVYAGNCPAAVVVWLAAQAAGLTPVTLNRAQRGRVLADVVRRSQASVIVADAAGMGILEGLDVVGASVAVTIGDASAADLGELRGQPGELVATPVACDASAIATIMFSSGTTGTSKGVMIPHGMFAAGPRRLREAWDVTPDDVFHCWAPWFHIAAQMDVFALAIEAGASVALVEGFSLSQFWQQVRESQATIFGGFVSVLEMLYGQEPDERDRQHRLRMGIAGHIPAQLRRRFEERFGVPMLDAYGMSEAEPLTIPLLNEDLPDGSCGRANPDFEIQVHDPLGQECPRGTEGQIVFRPRRDDVMMSGYLDEPDRTRAAWRAGWFLTGDLGTMDDQDRLYFRDRMAEFIRVRGENVSPQEVESVLMDHPAVVEVAVVGVPSPLGEHEVKAVIVRRAGTAVCDLPDWCDARMAKFMVPTSYEFVDALPRTPTSKVQRVALRDVRGETFTATELRRSSCSAQS